MIFADLIVETKTSFDRQIFSYQTGELAGILKVGDVVNVVFGRQKLRAVIIKLHSMKTSYPTKTIYSQTNLKFSHEQLKTILWLSNYYLVSLGEAFKMFLPPKLVRPIKIESVAVKDKDAPKKLTADQLKIFQTFLRQSSNPRINLLHGVTGSGKTEIFVHLIKNIIDRNGQVIYLLPEIFLASQILIRLRAVFGSKIAILHSKISRSEVFDIYHRFNKGDLKIIIGPRSALLVPPKNLKLIIVDEEHDDSYKQEQAPRYDARLLAEKIAEEQKAMLIFSSATPRLVTFQRYKEGKINFFDLPERYQQKLPQSAIVNMKDEIKAGNYTVISTKLLESMQEILSNDKQVIVFLNRRGLATFVSCRECGFVYDCPNCSIPLTQHLTNNANELHCHQCEYVAGLPARCPSCKGVYIKSFGSGLQKVELELKKQFPGKQIIRFDSDLKEVQFKKQIAKVENNQFDILLGTQMIAKGLDLPAVDLVGIISADTALHLPDYQSNERTFDLITQVSGRSGRRDLVGQTIIQTYWPENHAIICAAKHDYVGFFESELRVRKTFNYPPFRSIVRVLSQHTDKNKARLALKSLVQELKKSELTFTGQAPAFYKRLRGRYRYHLIIKIKPSERQELYEILKKHPDLLLDIDPVNML